MRKRIAEILLRSGVRASSHTGRQLLAALRKARRVPARLVGVRLAGLAAAQDKDQFVLFTSVETDRDRGLARAIDRVRGKFGAKTIVPGGILPGPSA